MVVERPPACSYRPGGSVVGTKEICCIIKPWMKYIAIVKSVMSRAPRSRVSARLLHDIIQDEASEAKKINLPDL